MASFDWSRVRAHVDAPDEDTLHLFAVGVQAQLESQGWTINYTDNDSTYERFGGEGASFIQVMLGRTGVIGNNARAAQAVYAAVGSAGGRAPVDTANDALDEYVNTTETYLVIQIGVIMLITLAAIYAYTLYKKGK